jgi:hypothetical protein
MWCGALFADIMNLERDGALINLETKSEALNYESSY